MGCEFVEWIFDVWGVGKDVVDGAEDAPGWDCFFGWVDRQVAHGDEDVGDVVEFAGG